MLTIVDKVVMILFIFFTMLAIGAQIDWRNRSFLHNKKGLWVKLLIANFVVVPLIGISIAKIFPLSPQESLALTALALTPGGINAIQFSSKIPGSAIDAAIMLLLLSLLAMVISPILIAQFTPPNIVLKLSYWNLGRSFSLALLTPLLIGIIIRHMLSPLAERCAQISAIIGTIAFIAMIILTLNIRRETISSHTGVVIMVMLLFIVLTMLTGWLFGGPECKTRQLFTIITSMRNVALCLAIVMDTAPTAKVITPLVALSALMVLPNMLLTITILTKNRLSSSKQKKKTSFPR